MSEVKKLTEKEMDQLPRVHIYGQYSWHEEAYIVGNVEGLIALRDAINSSIGQGQAKTEVMTGDGEGYDVHVIQVDSKLIDSRLQLPYIDEIARGDPEQSIQPWDLEER